MDGQSCSGPRGADQVSQLLVMVRLCVVWSPEDIHSHFRKCEVEYLQFAFRWMNNLLMRELPLRCTIRLWDTYQVRRRAGSVSCSRRAGSSVLLVFQAEAEGFSQFHLYVCAAFLLEWRKQILSMRDFQVPSWCFTCFPAARGSWLV